MGNNIIDDWEDDDILNERMDYNNINEHEDVIEDDDFDILNQPVELNMGREFQEVRDGGHGGHGYTGYEVHLEMAQLGWYNEKNKNDRDSKDSKSIWIYAEGKRPTKHFHFYRGKNRKAGGCIRLDRAMYFPHENHTDTLKPSEIKTLVKFLNSIDEEAPKSTIWESMLATWNRENSDFKIDINSPMPPYEDGIEYPK